MYPSFHFSNPYSLPLRQNWDESSESSGGEGEVDYDSEPEEKEVPKSNKKRRMVAAT